MPKPRTHKCNSRTSEAIRFALAFELEPTGENGFIQVLPAGEFTCLDGRGPFECDDATGNAIAAWVNARKTDLGTDYEHQSINAEKNGQPAPASGWIKRAEWRAGVGLFTYVEWTDRASAAIKAREYRYASPVFYTKKNSRQLLPYLGVPALVINPAIDGMAEAVAASADIPNQPSAENQMDLKQLLALLGLPDTATEADVIAKLKTLTASATNAASIDPSQYVPVAVVQELQTQVSTLLAASTKRETAELVAAAVAEGKLHTQQLQTWAASLAPDQLRAFLANAPAIPALATMQTQQSGTQQQATSPLSEAERQMCTRLGLTEQQLIAAKAA